MTFFITAQTHFHYCIFPVKTSPVLSREWKVRSKSKIMTAVSFPSAVKDWCSYDQTVGYDHRYNTCLGYKSLSFCANSVLTSLQNGCVV